MRRSVLIAGVGGASLGTEILKSLNACGNYDIYGADISPFAYGLYEEGPLKTYVVDSKKYVSDILDICKKSKIDAIIPGGEEPLLLLSRHTRLFNEEGIHLAINSNEVIELCIDKLKTFSHLENLGIPIPVTRLLASVDDLDAISYPCVIKPSRGSGGSVFVYLAEDREEAELYVSYLRKRDITALAQEYIPHQEGEYTVGVLSLPNGKIVGSIALKRFFNAKLSYLFKDNYRIVSSGYSQGLINAFEDIRAQAEDIALRIDSRGPLNIQGRLKQGVLYPFEINPRFSASTYLRTMAGFNEVDVFLRFLFEGKFNFDGNMKYGYYFRSLDEKFVSHEEISI